MQKKAQWIWFPRDFEFMLYHGVMHDRTERGQLILPFWRVDHVYSSVVFARFFELSAPDRIRIVGDGVTSVIVDDAPGLLSGFDGEIELCAGRHTLTVNVYRDRGLPCIYVSGRELVSDGQWTVNAGTTQWVPAGSAGFFDPESSPNVYRSSSHIAEPVSIEQRDGGLLADFGRELFAFLSLSGLGDRAVDLCYGESREEALDVDYCETTDRLLPANGNAETERAMAFRYVYLRDTAKAVFLARDCALDAPCGSEFLCSDETVNEIYRVALRTYRLTTGDFFLDGVKRDRWVWTGDVSQSIKMNFYTFFDPEVVKRSLAVLIGKVPPECHLNRIMDYSFYWILSLYDYYRYTGDEAFVKEYYDRAEGLLQFCLKNCDEEGFIVGKQHDWIFVDWANIANVGEVCFEQILLAASLSAMEKLSKVAGRSSAVSYGELAKSLKQKIFETFWIAGRGFAHSKIDKGLTEVTRYASLFAVLVDLLNDEQRRVVLDQILLNPAVQEITTPYMKFYELSALSELGRPDLMLAYVKAYWGGMLKEGATSFWECYDPAKSGPEQYAMYGRKYGMSLCHAWGASPLYLFGRYLAGVQPAEPGYRRFVARPYVKAFPFWRMRVPMGEGSLNLEIQEGVLEVHSDRIPGLLMLGEDLELLEGGYRTEIEPGKTYRFRWKQGGKL